MDNILFFDINIFFVGFGIVIFSYCVYVVFFGIEGSMRELKKFNKMMYVFFFILVVVKVLFGVFVVLIFGLVIE